VDAQLVRHYGLKVIEELREVFGVENLHWPWRTISPGDTFMEKRLPNGETEDMWGVRRAAVSYGAGTYEEVVYYPLASATSVEDIENWHWPEVDKMDFSNCRFNPSVTSEPYVYQDCLNNEEYALAGGCWTVFEQANYLRGFENFLLDLAMNEDIAFAIIRKIEEFNWRYNERMMEETKGLLDIFPAGDDFGSQKSLLMSLDMWKKYFLPGMKKAYAFAHRHGLKVSLHSDGSTKLLLPELIDIGLDIYDPIQPQAKDMDPYQICKEFGNALCFHGTIDVQKLLPFGSVQEIKDEVKRQIDLLAGGGGFFLAPSHCIQTGTPIENIEAIYKTAMTFGAY